MKATDKTIQILVVEGYWGVIWWWCQNAKLRMVLVVAFRKYILCTWSILPPPSPPLLKKRVFGAQVIHHDYEILAEQS